MSGVAESIATLERTATIIETSRWTSKVEHVDDETCVCLESAFAVAVDLPESAWASAHERDELAYGAILNEVRLYPGFANVSYPFIWNDEQRDKRKVVRLVRRAARRLAAVTS